MRHIAEKYKNKNLPTKKNNPNQAMFCDAFLELYDLCDILKYGMAIAI